MHRFSLSPHTIIEDKYFHKRCQLWFLCPAKEFFCVVPPREFMRRARNFVSLDSIASDRRADKKAKKKTSKLCGR